MGQSHHSQLSPTWESWFGALSGTNRDSPDHIPNAMERQRISTLSAIMNRNFKRPFSMTGAISQHRKRCQFLFLLDEKPLDKKSTIVPALAKRDYYLAGLQTNSEKKSIAIISTIKYRMFTVSRREVNQGGKPMAKVLECAKV